MMSYKQAADDPLVCNELRNQLFSGHIVLFAGSGLSAQASTEDGRHPPLWKSLLEQMVKWSEVRGLLEERHAEDLLNLVAAGYLIEAGQELQDLLDAPLLRQCLGQVVLC